MKIKRLFVVIALLLNLFISGCWSSHEVNTLGISVCLGIDKQKNGYLVSEQVINPKAIASQRAVGESPVVIYTGEGENLQEIITRMTTISSRKIYSSHLRMVILSEDVAREGIADIIDHLLRYHEYRTDFYFAVTKGVSANDILNTLTPVEAIPGVDMYKKLKMSFDEWAPIKAVKIVELANDLAADGINPTINAVELVDDSNKTDSTDVLKKSGNFEKISFTDIGAFKKDKLIGWLNETEAKGYSYIIGDVKHTSGYAAVGEGITVSYNVLKADSKVKASIVDNQPSIDVEIKLDYVITQVTGKLDVSVTDNIEIINKMAEDRIKSFSEEAVRKAQELKTDIFGFGERIHVKDTKYWKTIKENWNDIFANIPVNIRVTAQIVATGDITKSMTQKD